MKIGSKEIDVIKEISSKDPLDQRIIAKNTGLSLGLVNLIIKRLIKHGYIKTKRLNKKKFEYILTPNGLAEKTKKSYLYTIKTINQFSLTESKIQELIADYYDKGYRDFVVTPKNELSSIVEIAIKNGHFPEMRYKVTNNMEDTSLELSRQKVILLTSREGQERYNGSKQVKIFDFLVNSGIYF